MHGKHFLVYEKSVSSWIIDLFATHTVSDWCVIGLSRVNLNDHVHGWYKDFKHLLQQQYGYLVIQMLMSHLDTHTNSDPGIKASIIEVLYESVLISAGGSIGQY